MASVGGGMRVTAAVSGATTVPADSYAMVTYTVSTSTTSGYAQTGNLASSIPADGIKSFVPVTRYFGPGQSIPATFTSHAGYNAVYNAGPNNTTITTAVTVTYSLASGVIISNS